MCVHASGRGQHTVHIEQDGVKTFRVEYPSCLFFAHRIADGDTSSPTSGSIPVMISGQMRWREYPEGALSSVTNQFLPEPGPN